MQATPKCHMQDLTKATRPRDDLRPARSIVTWAGVIGALAIAAVAATALNAPPDLTPPAAQTVSGGQMILALSGCPTHDGTAHVLALVLSVDADGHVTEATCARVERPAYLPKRKVRS